MTKQLKYAAVFISLLLCGRWNGLAMAQLLPSSTEPGAIYLCNVPVSERVQNLRKRIESRLGNIQCLVVPGLRHNGAVGWMGYIDGRPTIKLDQGVGATESEVCHELLHFELDIRGWPKELPPFPAGMSHDDAHSITRAYLWSELQHRVVDDEAHKLGMTPDASYRAELLGTVQSGKAVPPIWRVFPQWAAISHARGFATDRTAALEISKQLRQTGQADVVPVAEALNDLLQGDAITKEQSAATLQRCLKMLWTRLPSYTISRQDLARINNTYAGGGP
jgi:hypothetical protein